MFNISLLLLSVVHLEASLIFASFLNLFRILHLSGLFRSCDTCGIQTSNLNLWCQLLPNSIWSRYVYSFSVLDRVFFLGISIRSSNSRIQMVVGCLLLQKLKGNQKCTFQFSGWICTAYSTRFPHLLYKPQTGWIYLTSWAKNQLNMTFFSLVSNLEYPAGDSNPLQLKRVLILSP